MVDNMYDIYFDIAKNDVLTGILLLEEVLNYKAVTKRTDAQINCKIVQHDSGLKVECSSTTCTIYYQQKVEIYRGIGLMIEKFREDLSEYIIEETPAFEQLVYMHDSSRNGVANLAYLKSLIKRLALMGYHAIMLYTEDTFEIDEEPYFGHFRGRYSSEELKIIDDYAYEFGIEMIPCIQTLAHLNAIFRWKAYEDIHDTKDILLCGENKTYALIEKMVITYKKVFRSRKINIGMDEAEMMGLGKYLSQHGYKERYIIMEEHLKQVLRICRKHGYSTMMWSDMFYKLQSLNGYYKKDGENAEKVAINVPNDLTLIYWDYYSRDENIYDRLITEHQEISDHCAFAGGAWKWGGYAPLLSHSLQVGKMALKQSHEHCLKTVIVTAWGDDGNEAANITVYPILQLYSEYTYHQDVSLEHLKKRFKTCVDAKWEDFLLMEQLNFTSENPFPGDISVLPSKYFFYQDPLLGIYDKHADDPTLKEHYEDISRQLVEASMRNPKYQYAFKTLSKLAEILAQKYDIGIRMQKAYLNKDRALLNDIACEIIEIRKNVEMFHEDVRNQWKKENKIFGLEVLDVRIAGVVSRLNIAYTTIHDYIHGIQDAIPELDVERLYHGYKQDGSILPLYQNDWKTIVTCSVI